METRTVPRADESGEAVKGRFYSFLVSFVSEEDEAISQAAPHQRLRNTYEDQILAMIRNDKTTVYVNFADMNQFDRELAEAVQLEYYRFEHYLRQAVQDYVGVEHRDYVFDMDKGTREFFVSIYNLPRVERIRNMRTETIGRLISFSGTVTRTSEVRPELLFGSFICRKCATVQAGIEQQCAYTEPQICTNTSCPSKDFQIMMEQSVFVDWQRLRVQENADEIPAGSMPRCIDVICRNDVVESAKAGDKIVFSGSVVVLPDSSGLANAGEGAVAVKAGRRNDSYSDGVQGLKRLGVREMTYKMIFIAASVQHTDQRFGDPRAGAVLDLGGGEVDLGDAPVELSEEERDEILSMRSSPKLYYRMTDSICPSVFGHPEVKRGILLMLFGGVHKKTHEGIPLRGDINVCIVGDPSCAKSQFLKYVHNFLPRSVYTSGKASSAAGLTASVVKDSETGEYCVEAGALMLADNGVCCIDEFDKMDPNDQVAIHEAMEQQTISITKAGIQATLNARTSILAAANPVFGRYDRTKTLKANVAISAAIMSRFDLFFVILDECNPKVDEAIARHIVDVHRPRGSAGALESRAAPPFTTEQLRRYIKFARRMNPMIDLDGKKVLVECYRLLRQNDMLGKNKTAYRITVRQLESLIRLSEALARLHLDDKVRPAYIREAYRLLQQSIIFVDMEDVELDNDEFAIANPADNDDDEEGDQESPSNQEVRDDAGAAESTEGATEEDRGGDVSGKRDAAALQTTDEAPAPEGDAKRRKKEKKAKTQLPYHEYRTMTQFIAIHLRQEEENAGAEFSGCKWGDIVAWYLQQYQRELTDEEEFERKRKVVSQVLRRMLKHEEAIIEVVPVGGEIAADTPNEDRMLKLHPSYEISS